MSGKYISVNITGGLGNHFFQIAAVITYNKHLVEKKQIVFKYEEDLDNLHNLPRKTFWHNLFKDQFLVLPPSEYNEIKFIEIYETHPHANMHPPFPVCPPSILFKGYFQSFAYMDDDIRQQLIDIAYSNKELVKIVADKYTEIKNTLNAEDDDDIVSMHIRRTDFIYLQTFHYILQLDYYKEALRIAGKKKIVVFSDDIAWCKENVTKDLYEYDNIYFVDINNVEQEFLLMSMCKHNIIANSTYSLWASFLSKYDNKIIIAPNNWYGPAGHKIWEPVYHKYITNRV